MSAPEPTIGDRGEGVEPISDEDLVLASEWPRAEDVPALIARLRDAEAKVDRYETAMREEAAADDRVGRPAAAARLRAALAVPVDDSEEGR